MNWIFAFFFTGAVFVAQYWIANLIWIGNERFISLDQTILGYFIFTVESFALAVWVYIDARSIKFTKYKGFGDTPFNMAFACFLLGLLYFVFYLQKRWKITSGQAELKPQSVQSANPSQISDDT